MSNAVCHSNAGASVRAEPVKRVLRGHSAYHPGARSRVGYRHRHDRMKAWIFWICLLGLTGVLVFAWMANRRHPTRSSLLDRRRLDELGPRP